LRRRRGEPYPEDHVSGIKSTKQKKNIIKPAQISQLSDKVKHSLSKKARIEDIKSNRTEGGGDVKGGKRFACP